jgi:flagellar motor switch protein FliM
VSKILSQDEIDVLLESSPHAAVRSTAGGTGVGSETVVGYNFRRPDRISKEQLRSLHFLHDRFAHNVSTSMSVFLRSVTEISIVSVEQFAYSEFLMSLPEQTAFYAVALDPLEGLAAVEMNPGVAFSLIDRLLGGTGKTPRLSRALTEIEQNVIDSVVKLLLDSLSDVWKAVGDVCFRIHARETRPQMLQVVGPNEIVVLLGFDMKVGETRGMLNLCIPASAIEAIGDKFIQGSQRTRRQPTAEESTWLAANLCRVPVSITAQMSTTIAARDLIRLRPGDLITLGRSATTPVDVYVGGLSRFVGRLSRDGQAVQVRIEPRGHVTAGVAA